MAFPIGDCARINFKQEINKRIPIASNELQFSFKRVKTNILSIAVESVFPHNCQMLISKKRARLPIIFFLF